MFAKNVLILLGLEASQYGLSFKQDFTPQLRTIEVLLQSQYFEKLHLAKEKSFLENDVDIKLISNKSYLKEPTVDGASGIFLVGYHNKIEDIAVQLKSKYTDSNVILIKNAVVAPPHGIDYDYLSLNQIQVVPV